MTASVTRAAIKARAYFDQFAHDQLLSCYGPKNTTLPTQQVCAAVIEAHDHSSCRNGASQDRSSFTLLQAAGRGLYGQVISARAARP
jgi:hypothetical protein